MQTITQPTLVPCCFCGGVPEQEIKEGVGEYQLYVYQIKHNCSGFDHSHITIFFKNDSTHESCMDTLRKEVQFYSDQWNRDNNKVAELMIALTAAQERERRLRNLLIDVADELSHPENPNTAKYIRSKTNEITGI